MATLTLTEPAPMETLQLKLTPKNSSQFHPHPPQGKGGHKMRIRLDPLRALEPARKKLSTLEAQRIMAVLVDTIKRTELVMMIEFVIENVDRFSIVLGADLVEMLKTHNIIMNNYEELKDMVEQILQKDLEKASKRRSGSRTSSMSQVSDEYGVEDDYEEEDSPRAASAASISSEADMALQELQATAQRMQHSCKNILREFSKNPSALNRIKQEMSSSNMKMNDSATYLIKEMDEMKDILLEKLLTTPTEEHERNLYLKQVTEQERLHAALITKLEAELQDAVDDKENEIKIKNDIIRRLQADLHQIEKFSEEHIRRTKSEAEKQEAADSKNSEGKKLKLQQEITQSRTQLQNLVTEHRDNEQSLRKRKYKIETEVENWIQKYDQDMGERQDEFEEIDAIYTEEKKQLHELEERFKTLETEYNQIQEERRVARERREAREREVVMMVRAATTIQAFWRSFKVRKALKGKKKKKGGKKGKK